jgi:transketolase
LGCCLSVVEMLIAMYASVDVEKIKANAPDRDRIFISKGHCAAATYAVMSAYGLIEDQLLAGYHSDGSPLAGLVSHAAPHVELSTGALGHGINVAAGAALGLKRKGYNSKVLCLCGDGEMQEGSVWEALMFASHHRLDNLIVLIDDNRIGSVTFTERVMRLPLDTMLLQGFALETVKVEGHDVESVKEAMTWVSKFGRPSAVICHTTKGKGVPFAENEPVWHYKTLDDQTYAQAMEALG